MIETFPPGSSQDYGSNVAPPPAGSSSGSFPSWSQGVRQAISIVGAIPQQLGFDFTAIGGGTLTAPTSTNYYTSQYRHRFTAATALDHGFNSRAAAFWRGNATGRGGFTFEVVFGLESGASAGTRLLAGLVGTATSITLSAGDPSAQTDCIFVGADAADTNLQLMVNDGSGTCTKTDLGSNFAKVPGTSTVVRARFSCSANGSAIDYFVERLDTSGVSVTGSASSNLPTNTTFMVHQFGVSKSGTGSFAAAWIRCMGQC